MTAPRTASSLSAIAGKKHREVRHASQAENEAHRTKREAIAKTFGNIPVDSESINFLYSRTGNGGAAIIVDELEQVIWKALDGIRANAMARILKEAADYLRRTVAPGRTARFTPTAAAH